MTAPYFSISESVSTYMSHYKTHVGSALYNEEDIDAYIEQVRLQRSRAANRNYHKYDDSIHGYASPDISLLQLKDELSSNKYRYCGVKETNLSLYKIYPYSKLYFEFISTAKDTDGSYASSQFIYIPIEDIDEIKHLLPTLTSWDTEKLLISNSYPSTLYLKPVSADRWPHNYYLLTDNLIHPFLGSDFVFNGRIVEQGDGSMLYEYRAISNNYCNEGSIWVSQLRPQYLDYPFGIPQENDLFLDRCSSNLIRQYPSKGYFPFYGAFTGYITTDNYSRHKQFYLYERIDGSTFLSEERPHSYSRDFIQSFISPNYLNLYESKTKFSISRDKKLHYLYLGIESDPSLFYQDLFRVQTLNRVLRSNVITGGEFDQFFWIEVNQESSIASTNTGINKERYIQGLKTSAYDVSKLSSYYQVGNRLVCTSNYLSKEFNHHLNITGANSQELYIDRYSIDFLTSSTSADKSVEIYISSKITNALSNLRRYEIVINENLAGSNFQSIAKERYVNALLIKADFESVFINTGYNYLLKSYSFSQVYTELYNHSYLISSTVTCLSNETFISSYRYGIETYYYIDEIYINWEEDTVQWGADNLIWNQPSYLIQSFEYEYFYDGTYLHDGAIDHTGVP